MQSLSNLRDTVTGVLLLRKTHDTDYLTELLIVTITLFYILTSLLKLGVGKIFQNVFFNAEDKNKRNDRDSEDKNGNYEEGSSEEQEK